jgi:hypothetical protein
VTGELTHDQWNNYWWRPTAPIQRLP